MIERQRLQSWMCFSKPLKTPEPPSHRVPSSPFSSTSILSQQQLAISSLSSPHFPFLTSLFLWSIWLPKHLVKLTSVLVSLPFKRLSTSWTGSKLLDPMWRSCRTLSPHPSSLSPPLSSVSPGRLLISSFFIAFSHACLFVLALTPARHSYHSPAPPISSCNHACSSRFLSNPPRSHPQSLQGKAVLLSLSSSVV